jgi:hypothetical protein
MATEGLAGRSEGTGGEEKGRRNKNTIRSINIAQNIICSTYILN